VLLFLAQSLHSIEEAQYERAEVLKQMDVEREEMRAEKSVIHKYRTAILSISHL
jgi:hypothetical protein